MEEKGNPAWEATYLETHVYHMKLLMYLIYQYLVNGSIYHLNDYQITKANSDEFKKNEIICLSKEIESEISCLSKVIESDKQLGIEANKAMEKNK